MKTRELVKIETVTNYIERFLNKHFDHVERDHSGISNSQYLKFSNEDEVSHTVRISDHELPVKYRLAEYEVFVGTKQHYYGGPYAYVIEQICKDFDIALPEHINNLFAKWEEEKLQKQAALEKVESQPWHMQSKKQDGMSSELVQVIHAIHNLDESDRNLFFEYLAADKYDLRWVWMLTKQGLSNRLVRYVRYNPFEKIKGAYDDRY